MPTSGYVQGTYQQKTFLQKKYFFSTSNPPHPSHHHQKTKFSAIRIICDSKILNSPEKLHKDDPPPFEAISSTKDLFETSMVKRRGFKKALKFFSLKMLFEIKKSCFTAERRILEKNITTMTPLLWPFYFFETFLEHLFWIYLAEKANSDFFVLRIMRKAENLVFLVVVVGDRKKLFSKKILYWYPEPVNIP